MATFGNFDYSQFKELQKKILSLPDPDKFVEDCIKELAARVLKLVKERSPSDTGTLRRNWTVRGIKQSGNNVYIEIINPVEYASYVEYGHRTKNHKNFVPGKFMLKTSVEEVQQISSEIIRDKMNEYFAKGFR